jgi:hypothetical protein
MKITVTLKPSSEIEFFTLDLGRIGISPRKWALMTYTDRKQVVEDAAKEHANKIKAVAGVWVD